MSTLFSPIYLRGLELRNRIVVSPMCQYSAVHGVANDWHFTHMNSLCLSGAAMFIVEATHVEAIGRITPGCLGLYDEACEAAFVPILSSIRRHSRAALTLQLGHAGRKASSAPPWQGGKNLRVDAGGWQTVAPSATPHEEGDTIPQALDRDGLARIKRLFVEAADRAARLGFDAIEIHSAHGYLLHQFLSPLSNSRVDEYGGSLENRMRFPLQVFQAVRGVFPKEKPIGVRISATDWVAGGWDVDQSIAYARQLKALGVDWIDVSSGGLSPQQKISIAPGYQVSFAEEIRANVQVPTMAVGLITEATQAEEIVSSGKADFVAVGRAMLYDPRWAWHAAAALGASVDAPPQYWRCQPSSHKSLFLPPRTTP